MIITWRLWLRRCKAHLDDTHELGASIWLAVSCWIALIIDGLLGKLLSWLNVILSDLQVKSSVSMHPTSRMVLWEKPPPGWLKLNVDRS